ncbi:MAG: hypothetical protein AAGF58_14915, partial [Pseudomonadota bacterium]
MRYIKGTSTGYEAELDATLPRVLALADRDQTRPTFGVADRQFWAWKLIDFPNGTFQGFANGLSSLLANEFIADTLPAEPLIH